MNNRQDRSKTWHRLRLLCGWSICVLPLLALADAPSLGPVRLVAAAPAAGGQTDQENGSPNPTAPSDPGQMPPGPPHGHMGGMRMPPEEEQNAEEWMQANAPRRWQYFQTIRAKNQSAYNRAFREFILPRIGQINYLKEHDPKLYDLRMQRVKLEDDAFGTLEDINASTDVQQKEQLTDTLKQQIAKMYDNTLAERGQRLDELSESLKTLQAQLQDDQKPEQKQKHVDTALKRALETGQLENAGRAGRMHGGPMAPPPTTQP